MPCRDYMDDDNGSYDRGHRDGFNEGHQRGYQEGFTDGRRADGIQQELDRLNAKVGELEHELEDEHTKEEELERTVARLGRANHNMEAALCAIFTELEERGITHEVMMVASQKGEIDLMAFWARHQKEDKTRIAKLLNKHFSEHELGIARRLLNGEDIEE